MEKSKVTLPTWLFVAILLLTLTGIGLSVFIGYRFYKYKLDAAVKYSELEQLYQLESSALSAELESARLHSAELERFVEGIQSGVSKLSELNKQSAESIRLLESSNTVIGAIFAEYARRIDQTTTELEQFYAESYPYGRDSKSDDSGSRNP